MSASASPSAEKSLGRSHKLVTFQGKQLDAIERLVSSRHRIVPITGPAGTGKTTLISEAYSQMLSSGLDESNIALAAPTGKAARRITEATGIPAVTIHKLLAFGKPRIDEETGRPLNHTGPKFCRQMPLPYKVVFVDEYAMVNESLHRDLVDALPPGGRLLVFGDVDQLPPIEPHELRNADGTPYLSPFERLLKLPAAVHLDVVYRQAAESGILFNARLVRLGKTVVRKPDFILAITDSPLKWLRERLNDEAFPDFAKMENQILVPTRRGEMGTHKLNTILQAAYNPFGGQHSHALPRYKHQEKYPVTIAVGDKVICEENTYDMRDYFARYGEYTDGDFGTRDSFIECPDTMQMLNGEIGIVDEIDAFGNVYIDFGDRVVTVPPSFRDLNPHNKDQMIVIYPQKRLSLGYAITTHKAQGSEFEHVVYLINRCINYAVDRNNFYTAITRARKDVRFVTDSWGYNNAARLTAREKAKIQGASRKPKVLHKS